MRGGRISRCSVFVLSVIDTVVTVVDNIFVGRSVTRDYQMSEDARAHWKFFDVFARQIILDGVDEQLVDDDPLRETYHKGPLKRPVGEANHKLDIQKWRILYSVAVEETRVMSTIYVVGEKIREKLHVMGKEYQT
ncbi:MAG: hypothetical protein A3G34_02225 [Candidatus Lindowbacteria bacterium RIFCSPLOWO2_12_FULL_62_27]|nr:MAG: hypothetical protein A3G34_02225 [Candidatus Lindowbacteria bacterium RIFCSPLOWO2_12_FULL_62_27]OGH61218.1 MAG: hypothetical protein A3I06_15565 [Candidatus Lindowbacteria bacterium RIFCSPLOWO2_02_FULL_62_12]